MITTMMDAATSSQVVDGDQDVLNKTSSANDGNGAAMNMVAIATPISHEGTVVDQLLLQDHQPTWSTTYTVPLYSSFGNHLGACESDNFLGARDDFNNGEHNIHALFDNTLGFTGYHSDKSCLGDGLIGRPSLDGSNDQSIFTNPDVKINNLARNNVNYQQQQNRGLQAPARSYSNVLHAQVSPQTMMQRRHQYGNQVSSVFDAHHQLSNSGLDLNQSDLSVQSTASQPDDSMTQSQFHHQQLPSSRPQQAAKHLSDFLSSLTQQQQRFQPATASQFQHAGTADSTSGNFGSIGGNLVHRHNHQQHVQRPINNSMLQRQSMNQENKPFPSGSSNVPAKRKSKLPFFPSSSASSDGQSSLRLDLYGSTLANAESGERFSRKVFVGGLPPDIDEEEIKVSFRRFGSLIVDWPHKAESKSYFPPKGYAFLLFQEESSVQALIDACLQENDKLYLCVSSPTIKDKPVQIRPWRLSDSDFVLDSTLALDPKKTVFVGGVPRPLKASELATIMNNLYGNVCYAGIDTDPDLKYPKGAGRVAFSNHQSYIAAISARFVHIHHSEIEKRVEVKPYVLDDQFCDECQGAKCNNKFAPFFCANITCLRYYCDTCWSTVHSQPGREFHKPLVKEGSDRPRGNPNSGCSSIGRNSGIAGDKMRISGNNHARGESSVGSQHQTFRW